MEDLVMQSQSKSHWWLLIAVAILLQVQAITFMMGNAMFLTIFDANNVDILHTIIGDDDGMIENIDGCGLDRVGVGATWRETVAWSAGGKETSHCPNLSLAFFLAHSVSRCRDNKQLVNYSIVNVPGVVVVCKRLGIRISFQC